MSPESVACAFDPNDDGVVQQPVEEGGRDAGSSEEDVAPFGEASVRGEDHRALFATRIDDLEDETCAAQGDGEATNFVDDEQRGPREEAYLFDELSLSFVFGEAVGEFGECRSLGALSAFDGGGEGGRKVAFSGSGRSAVPVPGLRIPVSAVKQMTVFAVPSACLPTTLSISRAAIGTPVPSIPSPPEPRIRPTGSGSRRRTRDRNLLSLLISLLRST